MRGADTFTESLFTMRHLDDFVPADQPHATAQPGANPSAGAGVKAKGRESGPGEAENARIPS